MAPQITRLALCFGVLVAGFFTLRSFAVPTNFGQDGWHRAEAPNAIAKRSPMHAGKEACKQCHEDKFKTSPHVLAGVACETCHGPAAKHAEDFDNFKPFKPSARNFCARCHSALVARRSSFPQIDPKTHNPESRCIDCHEIHPKEASKP